MRDQKYDMREIDRMRKAVRSWLIAENGGLAPKELEKMTELCLQTHVINNTDVLSLEEMTRHAWERRESNERG